MHVRALLPLPALVHALGVFVSPPPRLPLLLHCNLLGCLSEAYLITARAVKEAREPSSTHLS